MRTLRQMGYEAAAVERAKTDPFVLSWRQRGGFAGALARRAANAPTTAGLGRPRPASGHMPFPGHRHCGEWR